MNDTQEFIELVERHDRGLRALAYRLLRHRAAMDDVMQEAYLKAFRGFSGFRGDAQASTWLYRVVYNACLDELRKERRTREMPLEVLAELSGGADRGGGCRAPLAAAADPAEAATGKMELAGALALLPVEQRAAVLLVDASGLSYDEAAEVLGVPTGTVASRLNHARSALRKTLVEGRDHETV